MLFLPYLGIMDGCAQCCTVTPGFGRTCWRRSRRSFGSSGERSDICPCGPCAAGSPCVCWTNGARTGRSTFSLGCSREDLADLLGVNRSALSRELSRMREDGLIDCYRDSFRVLDPAGWRPVWTERQVSKFAFSGGILRLTRGRPAGIMM